jgi:hypothetical protein
MKIKLPSLPDPRTRDGIKTIVNFIVAKATTYTIMTLIRQNVDTENGLQDASLFIGAYVMGDMVGDATEPYVNKQIDEIADALADAAEQFKAAKAELQASA